MAFDPVSLLQARYGDATPDDFLWNDVLSLQLTHRSIRSYLPDPLPKGTLEAIVAAAQSAASSSNLQTWSVVAVEDSARRERFSGFTVRKQAHIKQAPLFLVWLADLARLTNIAKNRHQTYEALNYLELFITSIVDASLAAQNAAIAAESFGLGTVYIGGIRSSVEAVAAELNLPPQVFPVFGLCVGYPNPEAIPAVKPRLPQDVVLHRETYAWEKQEAAIAEYDKLMAEFYQKHQMEVNGDWSDHSVDRITSAARLGSRIQLREILNRLGFALQ